ncbi:MAG TPA: DUF5681 domain-containing protein [Roseococcus sp.]|nr:DUF5681 domain-containing protein [Roseococcus sp.]
MPADYEVGYGRPPSRTRFQKGRSGNPKGRPKGARNLATDLAEELGEVIEVRENGTVRRISKQRAMVKSLAAQTLKGNARPAAQLFSLAVRLLGDGADAAEAAPLSADEAEVMAGFTARLREQIRRERGAENSGGEPAP